MKSGLTRLEILSGLYRDWKGLLPESLQKLPGSGSSREYYRIRGKEDSVIGAINQDREENEAFIHFTEHFSSRDLPVPEIYLACLDQDAYLQEDLGDRTLFEALLEARVEEGFPEEIIELYKKALDQLLRFQIDGARGLDFSLCYPRPAFDRQSMQWDLSYFKYYFLKLAGIHFNEQRMENDFNVLIDFLLSFNSDFFLYRDFQSRNIMVHNGEPVFIDYQGGRRGALAYDVASLLFDAKADIPPAIREELFDHYLSGLKTYSNINVEEFQRSYPGFVLIRMMQAMGAYGFRGFYEKKTHFLKSIPYALENLDWFLTNTSLPFQIPELGAVLAKLGEARGLQRFRKKDRPQGTLTVSVNSFSYKKGIPDDPNGHGGGYVFDCRVLSNPGREEKYRKFTGKDKEVIEFLEQHQDVNEFMSQVLALVDMSANTYETRGFNHLMVSFGCTGGQHRSVYCAEKLAAHLRENLQVRVALWHREQD